MLNTEQGDLLLTINPTPFSAEAEENWSGRRSDFTAGGTVPEFHRACFPFKPIGAQQ
jgi:hypothetical protein